MRDALYFVKLTTHDYSFLDNVDDNTTQCVIKRARVGYMAKERQLFAQRRYNLCALSLRVRAK